LALRAEVSLSTLVLGVTSHIFRVDNCSLATHYPACKQIPLIGAINTGSLARNTATPGSLVRGKRAKQAR